MNQNTYKSFILFQFECISVTFVIDKVLFPHVNYISPSPIPNFKNAAILGWGKVKIDGYFHSLSPGIIQYYNTYNTGLVLYTYTEQTVFLG